MELVEAARRLLPRRHFEAWYLRRIQAIEREHVAELMHVEKETVDSYVMRAEDALERGLPMLEDLLHEWVHIRTALTIEEHGVLVNKEDVTLSAVVKGMEKAFFRQHLDNNPVKVLK